MNCKNCKIYKIYSVEVIHKITRRKSWLCLECWSVTKKHRLSSYSKKNYHFFVNPIKAKA